MDKITRIHIARVPYEASISAHEELSNYFNQVKNQLDPDLAEETMADIEVRVTEILSARHVNKNGIINDKDVMAIKEQLGTPEQFDDSGAAKHKEMLDNNETKKLLRDKDNAYIGGVASGLGAYLNIDPIFIRLAFIILTFFWGMGILLYVLFWVLVPEARSNSDKLQMRGETVTAATLQKYRNNTHQTLTNIRVRNIIFKTARLIITAGIFLAILVMLTLVGLANAALYSKPLHQLFINYHLNYLLLGLTWLLIMSMIGLLVVFLLLVWQKASRSLKVACFTLVSLLVVAIAGISTVTPFVVNNYQHEFVDNTPSKAIPITTNGKTSPSKLNIEAGPNLDVTYVVTNQPSHASYKNEPYMGRPNITINSENGTINVFASYLYKAVPDCVLNWCKNIYLPVDLTLYGPALQALYVNQGAMLNFNNFSQSNLSITANNGSSVNINNGYSRTLSLTASNGSSINTDNITASVANVSTDDSSNIAAPNSPVLNAQLPVNCNQMPLSLYQDPVRATLNGQAITVPTLNQDSCVSSSD